ncbi:MAG: hypothetical protein H7Y39_13365 [Nitrospiraceae bacterium]|nr:hypothetical protein [Nitrospiraceae bacterium]
MPKRLVADAWLFHGAWSAELFPTAAIHTNVVFFASVTGFLHGSRHQLITPYSSRIVWKNPGDKLRFSSRFYPVRDVL